MTSEDGYELPSMSRREALSGGSAAAVAVGSGLLAQSLIGAAAAQTAEPRISLGPDWVIDDDPDGQGAFVVEHTPNSNEYRFRDDGRLVLSEADIGQLAAALDANGNDITNVGALDTDQASITEGGAKIFQTSDQSIPDASTTTITFDSNDGDYTPGDVLTVDLANNKITVDVAGRYVIHGVVSFDSPDSGQRIECVLNVGGTQIGRTNIPPGASEFVGVQASSVTPISANTDVTLSVYQDSTGSKNTFAGDSYTQLEIGRIG